VEKQQLVSGDMVFVVRGFLSPGECVRDIALSEEHGYDDAPITAGSGFVMRKDIRNNDRVMIDDLAMAASLWERAGPLMPAEWFGWQPVGLNERFRYYRYGPGQRFAAHTDGCFERDSGERSQFTFMVYLNDDFEGGTTNFYLSKLPLIVRPETGMALVFAHRQLHEGMPVETGRKYVLRTDVMYRRMRQ
jgi:hypothetical protein